MKLLLTLCLLTLTLFAAHIDKYAAEMGFERDYKTALAKAKKAKKPLMMVLGADYCPWCRKFERKTLSSKLVQPYLKNDVITLIVDKRYDIESFPKEFRTSFTPKVFFINPFTQKSFYETTAYMKKRDFADELDTVKEFYKIN